MAKTIRFKFTNADAVAIEDAFASEYGYRDTLDNGDPNPQSKWSFVIDQIAEHIASVTAGVEMRQAKEALPKPTKRSPTEKSDAVSGKEG